MLVGALCIVAAIAQKAAWKIWAVIWVTLDDKKRKEKGNKKKKLLAEERHGIYHC